MTVILCATANPPNLQSAENAPAPPPAAAEKLHSVAVVRTWQDLLGQPEIDLGADGKVRLGIETLEARAGESITVYALFEKRPPPSQQHDKGRMLGPLKVLNHRIREFAEPPPQPAPEPQRTEHCYYLYRQAVTPLPDAPLEFLLNNRAHDGIARIVLKMKAGSIHPWTAFSERRDVEEAKALQDMTAPVFDTLGAPTSGYAFPVIDGLLPLRVSRLPAEGFDATAALPRLAFDALPAASAEPPAQVQKYERLVAALGSEDGAIRDAAELELRKEALRLRGWLEQFRQHADPEVRARIGGLLLPLAPRLAITFDGKTITVKSKLHMVYGNVQRIFLVRWWVNGKPYVPALPAPEDARAHSYTQVIYSQECKLEPKLDLNQLGAKSGDTLGVQLLYCPNDWHYAEMLELAMKKVYLDKYETEPQPTPSNVAEWKIP